MAGTLSKLFKNDSNTYLLSIYGPDQVVTLKYHIVIVLDKSGSMNCTSNEKGTEGTNLFSRLDVAKYAILMFIENLSNEYTVSLVVFDSDVTTLFTTLEMSTDGKNKAKDIISNIQPGSCTNLWDGLKAGLDIVNDNKLKHPSAIIYLLTDGEATESPREGEQQALLNYRKTKEEDVDIVTIGISYEVKNKVLYDIGNPFIFIPDGTMVITTFNNLLTNLKLNCAKKLTVTLNNKCSIKSIYPSTIYINSTIINIGNLNYSQKRDLLFEYDGDPDQLDITITLKTDTDTIYSIKPDTTDIQTSTSLYDMLKKCYITAPVTTNKLIITYDPSIVNNEIIRIKTIQAIKDCINEADNNIIKAKSIISTIREQIKYQNIPIYKDIDGEIKIALETNENPNFSPNWKRWGDHYMKSLIHAHINQICTNFKDPGPKSYVGDLYNYYSDIINQVCKNMPMLAPSLVSTVTGTPVISRTAISDNFNNQYGGCFGPFNTVSLKGGKKAFIHDIVKGDILDNNAIIQCVIKYNNGLTIEVNDLEITPYHPVLIDNEWKFPIDIATNLITTEYDYVYNFVLDTTHVITVNNIKCCTLGHNFTDNNVVKHNYYGTNEVIKDLMKFINWEKGEIIITNNNIIRNKITNLVCEIVI